MSIELPPELHWVAELAVGQSWPKGDEDKMQVLAQSWYQSAQRLVKLADEIDPATTGVLDSLGGPVADQFQDFSRQMRTVLPNVAESSQGIGDLSRNAAVQLEYTKYSLLIQLAFLAYVLWELASVGLPELDSLVITSVRAVCWKILQFLARNVVMGTAFMLGTDVAVQAIQFLQGDRTSWSWDNTLQAVEGGAIGGAFAGIFTEAAKFIPPKFGSALSRQLAVGGATGIATTFTMDAINGSFGDGLIDGLAAASGAIGGLYGGRRGGRPHDEPHLSDTDFKLPDLPDFKLPDLGSLESDGGDGIFTTPLPLDPAQAGNGTWARSPMDAGVAAGAGTGTAAAVVGRPSAESVRTATTSVGQPHTVNSAGVEGRSPSEVRTTGTDVPAQAGVNGRAAAQSGAAAGVPAVDGRSASAVKGSAGGAEVNRPAEPARSGAETPVPAPGKVGGGDVKDRTVVVGSPERVWQERVVSRLDALPGRVEVQSAKEAAARNAVDAVREAANGSWRQALPELGDRFTEAFGLGTHGADSRTEQAAALALARDAHTRIDTWAAEQPTPQGLVREAAGPKDPEGTHLPTARHVADAATAPAAARRHTALAVARTTALDDAAHEARTLARQQPGTTRESVERAVQDHTDRVGALFDRHFPAPGRGPSAGPHGVGVDRAAALEKTPGDVDAAVSAWTVERPRLTARLDTRLTQSDTLTARAAAHAGAGKAGSDVLKAGAGDPDEHAEPARSVRREADPGDWDPSLPGDAVTARAAQRPRLTAEPDEPAVGDREPSASLPAEHLSVERLSSGAESPAPHPREEAGESDAPLSGRGQGDLRGLPPARPAPARGPLVGRPFDRPAPVPLGEGVVVSGRPSGLDVRPVEARKTAPLGNLDGWHYRVTRFPKTDRAGAALDPEATVRSETERVPWWTVNPMARPPYFLVASGTSRGFRVQTGEGRAMMLRHEVADFLAADPAVGRLAPGVPVVLVAEHAGSGGLELPRLVAARTGRPVWSFTGDLHPTTDPQTVRTVMETVVPGDGSRPAGRWLLSQPGDLGAATPAERANVLPEPGSVTTAMDGMVNDDLFVGQTLTDSRHGSLGRAFLSDRDLAMREQAFARLGTLTTYQQADVDGHGHLNPRHGTDRPLPWITDAPGTRPYFLVAHGREQYVELPRGRDRGHSALVDAGELGHMLKRRPSLRMRPREAPIVLVSCLTGGEFRLPEWQMAQRLADTTGRTVYAPSNEVSINLHIRTGRHGDEGTWLTFRPGGRGAVPVRPSDVPPTGRPQAPGRTEVAPGPTRRRLGDTASAALGAPGGLPGRSADAFPPPPVRGTEPVQDTTEDSFGDVLAAAESGPGSMLLPRSLSVPVESTSLHGSVRQAAAEVHAALGRAVGTVTAQLVYHPGVSASFLSSESERSEVSVPTRAHALIRDRFERVPGPEPRVDWQPPRAMTAQELLEHSTWDPDMHLVIGYDVINPEYVLDIRADHSCGGRAGERAADVLAANGSEADIDAVAVIGTEAGEDRPNILDGPRTREPEDLLPHDPSADEIYTPPVRDPRRHGLTQEEFDELLSGSTENLAVEPREGVAPQPGDSGAGQAARERPTAEGPVRSRPGVPQGPVAGRRGPAGPRHFGPRSAAARTATGGTAGTQRSVGSTGTVVSRFTDQSRQRTADSVTTVSSTLSSVDTGDSPKPLAELEHGPEQVQPEQLPRGRGTEATNEAGTGRGTETATERGTGAVAAVRTERGAAPTQRPLGPRSRARTGTDRSEDSAGSGVRGRSGSRGATG